MKFSFVSCLELVVFIISLITHVARRKMKLEKPSWMEITSTTQQDKTRHAVCVNSLHIHPDGTRIATAGGGLCCRIKFCALHSCVCVCVCVSTCLEARVCLALPPL